MKRSPFSNPPFQTLPFTGLLSPDRRMWTANEGTIILSSVTVGEEGSGLGLLCLLQSPFVFPRPVTCLRLNVALRETVIFFIFFFQH